MAKGKYTYQSYDYSFLQPKDPWYVPMARKVCASTIGFDLVSVQPMDEPRGEVFWVDPTFTTATEPGAQNDSVSSSATAATYSGDENNNNNNNNNVSTTIYDWIKLRDDYNRRLNNQTRRYKQETFFKRRNFFRNLRNKRYGKKI